MEHLAFTNLVRGDLEDYCPASNLAFNEHIKSLQKQGRHVYHFGFGQAPFPVMPEMVAGLQSHAGQNGYLPVVGIPELRHELCEFHAKYDCLHFKPDQIVVAPGSKELIFLLLNVFCGDVYVLSPTWTTYKPQSRLAGRKIYHVQTSFETGWKIMAEALEKTILENNSKSGNKLLILCNPDNPTGVSYSSDHLKELSAVCRKHNLIVLCDEIYARLHYDHNHDSLARYYPEGVIISSGMSKWASAGGWRLGYHIYPAALNELRNAVKSAASHTYSCAPAPVQYAVAEALHNTKACEEYILHTTRVMAAVADYCYRELSSVGVKVQRATAGYYIFPDFQVVQPALQRRGITTCEQMCDTLLEEANIALMAGGPAFLRPVDEFTTRLCFVNFDGKHALEASQKIGLNKTIGDAFVQEYAKETYDGIQVLKRWIQSHS